MRDPSHVLIAGPTASGKSELALRFAERGGGLIVNADALQVYENWQVLTARPGREDLARAPHRLYGHVGKTLSYSAGAWLREVQALLAGGERLIIVGGTGLYFMALLEGLAEIPPTPDAVRDQGDALMRAEGADAFRAYLRAHDPVLFERMDQHNPARLQRAWEVHQATGRPLSAWQAETGAPVLRREECRAFVLNSDPAWLRARIDRRLEMMLEMGALEECRANMRDWDPALPSSKALGAPEFIAHLHGALPLEAALAAAKTATHQYAKRQRTWFRRRMALWRQVPAESLGQPGAIDALLDPAL